MRTVGAGVVIFDGDDTLWETESLYDHARSDAAKIVQTAGLPADLWEDIERKLDVANVARFGLSKLRFPTSCVEAYRRVAALSMTATSDVVERRIQAAARSVFQASAPTVPGARRVLAAVRRHYRTVLLTQGEPEVQRHRVATSGLTDLFDVVEIVDSKQPAVFAATLAAMAAEPSASWMVGNSVRSDVNPAVASGMNVIWVDAHVWEHERSCYLVNSDAVHIAETLDAVPGIIADGLRAGEAARSRTASARIRADSRQRHT
jgi:putative hydrolase of the HAD superfamily